MNAMTGFASIGVMVCLSACASAPGGAPAAPAVEQSAAQTASPSAAPAQAGAETTARLDPNETICRRQQTTGSRFAQTRCQTRYQWDVEERLARKQIEENRKGAPPPTN